MPISFKSSWLLLAIFCSAHASSVTVDWVKKPPTQIAAKQSFDVSWDVKGMDGSYHAVCFLCPESAGPVCRKGPHRYDSEMFNSNAANHYEYTFNLDADVPEGRYYVTAIGAYSRSDYHASEPVLVTYTHSSDHTNTQSNQNQAAPSSTTDSHSESSSTVIVRPAVVAPYFWQDESSETNVTVNGENASENQEQRQDAYQQNHEQRQDEYQQQQRQNNAQEHHNSNNHHGSGERHQHGQSGRGGFGGARGGRR